MTNLKPRMSKQQSTKVPAQAPSTYQRGVVPKYLRDRREEEMKEETEEPCPDGHVLLPEDERKETLRVLRQSEDILFCILFTFGKYRPFLTGGRAEKLTFIFDCNLSSIILQQFRGSPTLTSPGILFRVVSKCFTSYEYIFLLFFRLCRPNTRIELSAGKERHLADKEAKNGNRGGTETDRWRH